VQEEGGEAGVRAPPAVLAPPAMRSICFGSIRFGGSQRFGGGGEIPCIEGMESEF
jgi:hypothetical protein